jgi:hypothetical protein
MSWRAGAVLWSAMMANLFADSRLLDGNESCASNKTNNGDPTIHYKQTVRWRVI